MKAPLGRDWLAAHLPHQGAMSLLDEIVRWDATTLVARAGRHGDTGHPLRRGAELPITAGIEYGAQAAAAHGALMAGSASSQAGFLASVRDVTFHARRLDDIPGPLEIVAEQLASGAAGVMYRFEVSAAARRLVEGRVTVAFRR
jgi:predicted hotdog family 3-hydroxylacyl-ACP dehydratase